METDLKQRGENAFPLTKWSLVVSAAEDSAAALEELCLIYWRPVYYYLRRRGYAQPDAEDLTQSYFERILKQRGFEKAQDISGRLRFYLLGGLKRHLADYHRRKGAAKRGGGKADLPLATSEMDFQDAEYHYAAQPADEASPEKLFDQSWALDLLSRAHETVRAQYAKNDKLAEYELLKSALVSTADIDAPKVAQELGVNIDSVRTLATRLRRTFRAAMKEDIAQTVTSREEVEEELAALVGIFS